MINNFTELIEKTNIHECWKPVFHNHEQELNKIIEYYNDLDIIYPPKEYIFRVFEMNIMDIKLVILGQDCYHGKGQANGLAFSVNNTIRIPPSLVNIFKEIKIHIQREIMNFLMVI